jgi:hypothetical protein
MEQELKSICEKALEECTNGKFHQSLKILYQSPNRSKVDWTRFPFWAVPNAETEGCHEG